MRTRILFAICLAAGCGRELKASGEECVASSECEPGLVCDLGQSPAVCAGSTTRAPDAEPGAPDAPPAEVDAPPAPIDGPPAPIDGPPPPDAEVPDAEVPDAMPDAM